MTYKIYDIAAPSISRACAGTAVLKKKKKFKYTYKHQ